jgi:hypothetical protein
VSSLCVYCVTKMAKTPVNKGFYCPKNVQKKLKKIVDLVLRLWDIHSTHGNNKTKNMRTKTLLIAAATLAVGAATSMAQTTYSQNIVGYANVVMQGNGQFTLVANPFDDGNGNQLTNLVGTLPNKSQVITWAGTVFNTPIQKGGGVWGGNTSLPPGTGFFVKNGAAGSPLFTNTFVGSVMIPAGTSLTNPIPAAFSLAGSYVPYAGDATSDTNINLGNVLANKSQLISWNTAGQVYDTPVQKGGGVWGSAFNVSVGQGFFINAKTATNWVQTLNP